MQWVAHYSDDTSLSQYNGDGSENRYSDIERGKLIGFSLLGDVQTHKVLSLHLKPSQRLIYRRRVEMIAGEQPVIVYLVGWQELIQDGSPDGRNLQSIACVFPDLHIEWFSEWREGHQWFYPIQWMDCEGGQ